MEEINLLDELINSDIKDETMDIPKEAEPIQEGLKMNQHLKSSITRK